MVIIDEDFGVTTQVQDMEDKCQCTYSAHGFDTQDGVVLAEVSLQLSKLPWVKWHCLANKTDTAEPERHVIRGGQLAFHLEILV